MTTPPALVLLVSLSLITASGALSEEEYYTTNSLPPPGSTYLAPGTPPIGYAGGRSIANLLLRRLTPSVPPPAPGGSRTDVFSSSVELNLSTDGGSTYAGNLAPATVTLKVTHSADLSGTQLFDTEMLALDIASGTLPAGTFIRESPTLASIGKTTIRTVPGGYMIDSFFDVFTEISTDGGATWAPTTNGPARVQMHTDPALASPVVVPTILLPPPNECYAMPPPTTILFTSGVIVSNLQHRLFASYILPPAAGANTTHTFGSQLDFQLSTDSGATFQARRAPAMASFKITSMNPAGTNGFYDTELLQLNVSGGDLPAGIMVRESPTRASRGGMSIATLSNGMYQVSSFFDIFMELSSDGGITWQSAANGPARLTLTSIARENPFATTEMLPATGDYVSVSPLFGRYGSSNVAVKDLVIWAFTASFAPPPHGGSATHTCDAIVDMMYSRDGGTSFSPQSAPATLSFSITSRTNTSSTECFDTEMLSLTISGGTLPGNILIRESPTRVSPGRTTERMAPGGVAMISSFFDVFTEVSADGGASWTPSTIGPGVLVLRAPEIDTFASALARVTIQYPDASQETVTLRGSMTQRVSLSPAGAAADTDGNGLDQVATEMVQLDLYGTCSKGHLHLTLDPAHRTRGEMEERVNNTPGTLDIPPFAPTGSVDSFFDVFFKIESGQDVLYGASALRLGTMITHKPPAPGETYTNVFSQAIMLLDQGGQPTSISLVHEELTPTPIPETDVFPYSLARLTLGIQEPLKMTTETITLTGLTTMRVGIPPEGWAADMNGNGLDEVPAEMTQMELRGNCSRGPILVTISPLNRTTGEIEENANNQPGTLDIPPFTPTGSAYSFFDVFFEINLGGTNLHGASSVRLETGITHKPPAPNETYTNNAMQSLPLLDAKDDSTIYSLLNGSYTPNPHVEIDVFTSVVAGVVLYLPNQQTNTVRLAGSMTVNVLIPTNGAAADTDGDGRDQVLAEMVQLSLHGDSPVGPVTVRLNPLCKTWGEIEEQANNSPGILDVPPFTPTGMADSFFDVFLEVEIAGETLHSAQPVRISATLSHKPPAVGETYFTPVVTPTLLVNANGYPSGVVLLHLAETPAAPKLRISHLPPGKLELAWPLPSPGFLLQTTTNLMAPTGWVNEGTTPVESNGERRILMNLNLSNEFFRLMRSFP